MGFTLWPLYDGGTPWAVVTVNWSTPEWSVQGGEWSPLPGDLQSSPWLEERYITRAPALFADALVDVDGRDLLEKAIGGGTVVPLARFSENFGKRD